MVPPHAIAFDRTSAGVLTPVRDARDLPAAEASARAIRDLGTEATMLDGPAALAMDPSLAPIRRDIVGGILTAEDHSGDIHAFTTALAAAAAEAGVAFRFGVDVQGLRLSAGRVVAVETASGPVAGDAVVLAAGSVSRALGRTASLDRLARMAVLDGVRDGIDPRFVDRTRRALRAILPTLPEHAAETVWSGCRPMTPDGPPILGPTRIPNLFLNTGLGALGWTLGCGAAQVVADLVAGRPPPVDAAAFALAR